MVLDEIVVVLAAELYLTGVTPVDALDEPADVDAVELYPTGSIPEDAPLTNVEDELLDTSGEVVLDAA